MKNIFLFVLLSLSFYSCTPSIDNASKRNQDWVWWVDKATGKGKWIKFGKDNPVQNGTYTTFYFNGNIYEIGKLRDGVRVDTLYRFDINGQPDSYVVNADSSNDYYYYENGLYKRLFRNGKLFIKGIVFNHKPGDTWHIYYENGNTKYDRDINNDSGYFFKCFENGKPEAKMFGKIVKKDDSISSTIDTGVFLGHYFLINGTWTEYFESGQIKDSIKVLNSLPDETNFIWYDNGNIKAKTTFVNGKRNGMQYGYYENGKPELVCTAANGEIIGRYTLYDEDGKIKLDTFFKAPIPVR